ncbi:hypothetical protein [Caulobacter soli]|uniref:hypothetical protein n=1 Tax=Caulobacter soli TaxID=2708539 RepID=UPI0013ED04F0|nr:hypothetical protein [Caulobacter soli]
MKNPFAKLFGGRDAPAPPPSEAQNQDHLVIVPIPPLVVVLAQLEKEKGRPLTEAEVIEARGKAICMTMAASRADALAQARGYADLDPAHVWEDWLAFKSQSGD